MLMNFQHNYHLIWQPSSFLCETLNKGNALSHLPYSLHCTYISIIEHSHKLLSVGMIISLKTNCVANLSYTQLQFTTTKLWTRTFETVLHLFWNYPNCPLKLTTITNEIFHFMSITCITTLQMYGIETYMMNDIHCLLCL